MHPFTITKKWIPKNRTTPTPITKIKETIPYNKIQTLKKNKTSKTPVKNSKENIHDRYKTEKKEPSNLKDNHIKKKISFNSKKIKVNNKLLSKKIILN